MQYQTLKPDRIIDTQRKLRERIARRFPSSGLSELAGELQTIAEHAAIRADAILRPNIPLRAAVLFLLLATAAFVIWAATAVHVDKDLLELTAVVGFVSSAISASVFLTSMIVLLVTLEVRMRRRRALRAIHELRALAHVVDMHQVAKNPESLFRRGPALTADPDQTTRTPLELNRYLNYCIELLTIISKIAALYVQQFPDAPTVGAVDQLESLCTELSQKIWQKIMMLDRLAEEKAEPCPEPAPA